MSTYKVLISLDGSPLAEHSLAYIPALSRLGTLELHLLSVVDETEEIHSLSSTEVKERERNVLTTYLHETALEIERRYGIKPLTEVEAGVPASVIQNRADDLEPDLIVISTHGRSGLSRWRRGSVAAKLMHGSQFPILAVGPRAADQAEWRAGNDVETFGSILVPLDGSTLAEQALGMAGELAPHFGAQVHLVRAVPLRVASDTAAASTGVDLTTGLEEAAAEQLAKATTLLPDGAEIQTAVGLGSADTVLEEYIEAQQIELVVMTSHGRSGLIRAALGSVTDRLIGNGTAPVLVIRSRS